MASDPFDEPIPCEPPPRGFTSRAGKRAVLRRVLVVGGVFVALQVIVPIVSMVAVFGALFEGLGKTTRVDPARGALWQGALWLVETTETRRLGRSSLDAPPEIASRILKWSPVGGGQPEIAPLPAVAEARLVAAGDALWAIGDTRFVKMTRAGIAQKAIAPGLVERRSAAFKWGDRPALIGSGGDGALGLFALDDAGAWTRAEAGGAPIVGGQAAADLDPGAIVVPAADSSPAGALVAGRCADRVVAASLGAFGTEACGEWAPIGEADAEVVAWTAARVVGKAAVFVARVDGIEFAIEGFAAGADGTWQRFFETRAGVVSSLAAFDQGDGRRFLLAIEGMPGAVAVHEVAGAEIARSTKLTSSAELERMRRANALSWASNLAALLTPIALLLALAGALRRHRIAGYEAGGRAAVFAPLWRRCAAGAIDVILAFGPAAAAIVGAFVVSDMQEEGAAAMLRWTGWIGLACLWSLLWLFALALAEGRFGTSPGKRLLGLRVLGVDLAPCGFGRALLRNVLELVDAVFGYAVGLGLIALTPNQQRLGDLAARTVVVVDPARRREIVF
jgi:uncharacterized RDD family membrane protein YckC